MPAVMTYDSLVQDIKNSLERADAADATVLQQIPRVINNTERTLADRLKITGYLGSFTGTMQQGENRIAKPNTWRSTASINCGGGPDFADRTTLRQRSYEYMRIIYPVDSNLAEPEFYCDYTLENWLVLPTPARAFPFEVMMWFLPP